MVCGFQGQAFMLGMALISPNCSCIMIQASQKNRDVKKNTTPPPKKKSHTGLVSLSSLSESFKSLFSMTMKSRNLCKS